MFLKTLCIYFTNRMQIKFYYNFTDLCELLYKIKLYYLLQNLLPFHIVYTHTKNQENE